MAELKVGGEVDGYCTKCKMILAHTVLAVWAGAIKRVRCNTCMGEHAYHKGEPGTSSPSSKPSRPRSPATSKPRVEEPKILASYTELMEGKDRASAQTYSIKARYSAGELVQHPTFGLGGVAAVRGLEKVDVAFPTSIKTLLHNKGSTPTMTRPPAPKRPDVVEEEGDPAAETSDES